MAKLPSWLSKKVGPFPVIGWLGIGAVGIGVGLYLRKGFGGGGGEGGEEGEGGPFPEPGQILIQDRPINEGALVDAVAASLQPQLGVFTNQITRLQNRLKRQAVTNKKLRATNARQTARITRAQKANKRQWAAIAKLRERLRKQREARQRRRQRRRRRQAA